MLFVHTVRAGQASRRKVTMGMGYGSAPVSVRTAPGYEPENNSTAWVLANRGSLTGLNPYVVHRQFVGCFRGGRQARGGCCG